MKEFNKEILNQAIGWDILNWSKALPYWMQFLKNYSPQDSKVLELGCGVNAGLSLWFANLGYNVTCSSNEKISDNVKKIHNQFGYSGKIKYEQIDGLNIPYESFFDIISFKSVLGGITRNQNLTNARKMISEIRKSLKPGGLLIFSENLTSSSFHLILRKKYGAAKNNWYYYSIDEIQNIISDFSHFEFKTFGFLGCFGFNEQLRNLFGKIDSLIFDKIPNNRLHYIIAVSAIK